MFTSNMQSSVSNKVLFVDLNDTGKQKQSVFEHHVGIVVVAYSVTCISNSWSGILHSTVIKTWENCKMGPLRSK